MVTVFGNTQKAFGLGTKKVTFSGRNSSKLVSEVPQSQIIANTQSKCCVYVVIFSVNCSYTKTCSAIKTIRREQQSNTEKIRKYNSKLD